MKDAKLNDKNLYNGNNQSNSVNGINQSNLVIGIKLLLAQSDPIKRRPLYICGLIMNFDFNYGTIKRKF